MHMPILSVSNLARDSEQVGDPIPLIVVSCIHALSLIHLASPCLVSNTPAPLVLSNNPSWPT